MKFTSNRCSFVLAVLCFWGVSITLSTAAKVVWKSIPFTTNLTSDGEALDDGFTFELGTFAAGFTPRTTNTERWAENWTALDRTKFHEGNQFFASTATFDNNEAPFVLGAKTYIWGFNATSPAEWILVSDSDWTWPDAALGFPVTWQLAEASEVILGSVDSSSNATALIRTASVVNAVSSSLSPEQWLATQFDTGQMADESVSGLTADPDGDGLDNRLEMALGTDPTELNLVGDLPYSVDFMNDESFFYLRITVTKKPIQGLSYRVETSPDLLTWHSGQPHTHTLEDSVTTLMVRDNVPYQAGTNRFIRLVVDSDS